MYIDKLEITSRVSLALASVSKFFCISPLYTDYFVFAHYEDVYNLF